MKEVIPIKLREEAIKFYTEDKHENTKQVIANQINRTGVWGTCVDCPDKEGKVYGKGRNELEVLPEKCLNIDRYDHRLIYEFKKYCSNNNIQWYGDIKNET
jgi:hypothetical protein